jgi:hypothetical protein
MEPFTIIQYKIIQSIIFEIQVICLFELVSILSCYDTCTTEKFTKAKLQYKQSFNITIIC